MLLSCRHVAALTGLDLWVLCPCSGALGPPPSSFLPCGPPYASLLLCALGGPRLPLYRGGVAGASTRASTWRALVRRPGADAASGTPLATLHPLESSPRPPARAPR